MAVKLDNMDSVLKQLAKMEKAVATEVIREARGKMRALMRSQLPKAKSSTPVGKTGQLAKSPKVRSRSRRGVSTAQVIWNITDNIKKAKKAKKKKPYSYFLPNGEEVVILPPPEPEKDPLKDEPKKKKKFFNYAGVVNFKKDTKSSKFATDLWNRTKPTLDQEGLKVVKESFEEVFKRHGVKFE